MRRDEKQQKMAADWTHPIGTPVEVMRGDGSKFVTKTRGTPWGDGASAFIMVDGCAGGYLLERVRRLSPEEIAVAGLEDA